MARPAKSPEVDAYIAGFPKEIQAKLKAVRQAIRAGAPEAEEGIGYKMPAYRFHGALLYFAAFTGHYSVFGAGPVGLLRSAFPQLSRYEGGKGTLQFPLDEPVPARLIRDIARYRAKENLARQQAKAARPAKAPGARSAPRPRKATK